MAGPPWELPWPQRWLAGSCCCAEKCRSDACAAFPGVPPVRLFVRPFLPIANCANWHDPFLEALNCQPSEPRCPGVRPNDLCLELEARSTLIPPIATIYLSRISPPVVPLALLPSCVPRQLWRVHAFILECVCIPTAYCGQPVTLTMSTACEISRYTCGFQLTESHCHAISTAQAHLLNTDAPETARRRRRGL